MASPLSCATKSDFDNAIKAAGSKLVVVDFTASWCGPCKMIAPVFEDLARKYSNVVFLKVDVDQNRPVAQAYSVSAMPTFLFLRNNSVIDTVRGANKADLTSKIQKHAGSSGSSGSGPAFTGQGNRLSGGSRPAFNPWGDDDDEEEEGEEKGAESALQAYLQSQQAAGNSNEDAVSARMREERIKAGGSKLGKSRFQREKEEAERKKQEEEVESARAYQEFIKAMNGEDTGSAGRSSAQASSSRARPMGFVSAGGASVYDPTQQRQSVVQPQQPPRPADDLSPSTGPRSMRGPAAQGPAPSLKRKASAGMFGDDEDDEEAEKKAAALKREASTKKKSAMSGFLSEIQQRQAEREEQYKDKIAEGKSVSAILALEGQKVGSRDLGDPLTTNVCVLNLPANITERSLGEFFSQWGDIGSVKIMWPRGEEVVGGAGGGITLLRNTRSAGLTGFVCYMKREDAELAMKEADGITWGGCMLKCSWGKAMSMSSTAMFVTPASAAKPRASSRSPPPTQTTRKRSFSPGSRQHRRPNRSPSPRSQLHLELASSDSGEFVKKVADRVREYGPTFEMMIRDKERDNPRFAWMRDDSSPQSQYLKALLDPRYIPTIANRPFTDEGYASMYESDSGEDSEDERLVKQRKSEQLGRLSQKRFEAMLRGITPRRERIARAMTFAMEHTSAAETVVDLLVQSLLIPTTPVPRKVARLYVLSDILHNTSSPLSNAWRYRSIIEARIHLVFYHLGDVARSFPGLMKQEGFKTQIKTILDVWDSWMVFAPDLLEGLRAALETGSGGATKGTMVDDDAAAAAKQDIDIDGEVMDTKDAKTVENLDGEAMPDVPVEEEDLDGEVM